MIPYNPFDTDIENLKASHLTALKTVNEGWYVEYKRTLPNAQSIAKSISALANTYGGWVFYGIAEESKQNSVAGEFPGIDASEVDGALQTIRQSVSGLMNPACHYEVSAVYGPSDELPLEAGRAVICITVPQSLEAPHVHKTGRIYRRVADGSEPVPEDDRFMIEKMFQRSTSTVKDFKKWLEKDPEFSELESKLPYLRIMMVPNLWQMPRAKFKLNVDIVKETLNETAGRKSAIPFDTIYQSANTLIARQCGNNNPLTSTLTWKIFADLSSDILLPLPLNTGTPHAINNQLRGHEYIDDFTSILANAKIDEAKIVNLNYVYNAMMGIIESQRSFQTKAGWPLSFHVKIKAINIWRTIPFLDVDYFIDHIEQNGIPISLTSEGVSPPGYHPDTFKFVNNYPNDVSQEAIITLQTLASFVPIAETFGFPLGHLIQKEHGKDNGEDEPEYFFGKLTNAGIRSSAIKR